MTAVLKAKLLAGIFLVAIAIAAPAQTVSPIYQFSNGSNPNYPAGVMAQDRTGTSTELRCRATDAVRASFTKSALRECARACTRWRNRTERHAAA
jgi:hypothetical protein